MGKKAKLGQAINEKRSNAYECSTVGQVLAGRVKDVVRTQGRGQLGRSKTGSWATSCPRLQLEGT